MLRPLPGYDAVRTTTDALIFHAQRQRLFGKLRNLVSIASQGIERNGKCTVRDTVAAGIGQRLKVNFFRSGAIRNRERGQRPFDFFADLFQYSQHGVGATNTIHSNHIRPCIL